MHSSVGNWHGNHLGRRMRKDPHTCPVPLSLHGLYMLRMRNRLHSKRAADERVGAAHVIRSSTKAYSLSDVYAATCPATPLLLNTAQICTAVTGAHRNASALSERTPGLVIPEQGYVSRLHQLTPSCCTTARSTQQAPARQLPAAEFPPWPRSCRPLQHQYERRRCIPCLASAVPSCPP